MFIELLIEFILKIIIKNIFNIISGWLIWNCLNIFENLIFFLDFWSVICFLVFLK